ncbi:hypothetical protein DPMN_115665 [Dreissena polymorpha]|uniref:Uncharacterized protein n=1 Tax=Dreissena polymorpha TaxID=45954 RepID=A0A9D4KM99_DREPO|nr:hypothetical protein DPMN_115665 [Dreissena polymorpha]
METPFLSFCNPNYQPNNKAVHTSPTSENNNNQSDAVNINIMSAADEKQEQTKLINGEIQSLTSTEEDSDSISVKSGIVSGEEAVSDEENDFVVANTKFVGDSGTDSSDEKLNNTECMNMAYGEKGKGILAYISLLEQSARERSERKRREQLLGVEGDQTQCDSGNTTPASLAENIKLKTYVMAL